MEMPVVRSEGTRQHLHSSVNLANTMASLARSFVAFRPGDARCHQVCSTSSRP